MIKKLLSLATCAAMLFSLSACVQSDKNPTVPDPAPTILTDPVDTTIRLTVWAPQEEMNDDTSWVPVLCRQFMDSHPEWELQIRYGVCDFDLLPQLGEADLCNAADVFFFRADQLDSLIRSHRLAALDGDALSTVKKEASGFFLTAATGADGKVYGFPYYVSLPLVFYNRAKIYPAETRNLDSMLERNPISMDLTDPDLLFAFYSCGDVDGVTEYLENLIRNTSFRCQSASDAISLLGNDDCGAAIAGASFSVRARYELDNRYSAAPLPSFGDEGLAMDCRIEVGVVGVNPASTQPEAAMALAEFLSSAEAQRLHMQMHNAIPTSSTLLAYPAIAYDDTVDAVMDAVANAGRHAAEPMRPELKEALIRLGTCITEGQDTADAKSALRAVID